MPDATGPRFLRIVDGPDAGAKSDAQGDDQAYYDAAANKVVFHLGDGASAVAGGSLPSTETLPAGTTVEYRAVIDRVSGGKQISNTATATSNEKDPDNTDAVSVCVEPAPSCCDPCASWEQSPSQSPRGLPTTTTGPPLRRYTAEGRAPGPCPPMAEPSSARSGSSPATSVTLPSCTCTRNRPASASVVDVNVWP
ncbi:hypothetical protein [Streptomyces sp. SID161]|uniref:hypothetical protein n=1 Tax=Streptomyces sp. SID161 TaxID=2690251 RepID=UPI001F48CCED|nr:hypothetical protein [Streptomyces sp. SID161]